MHRGAWAIQGTLGLCWGCSLCPSNAVQIWLACPSVAAFTTRSWAGVCWACWSPLTEGHLPDAFSSQHPRHSWLDWTQPRGRA